MKATLIERRTIAAVAVKAYTKAVIDVQPWTGLSDLEPETVEAALEAALAAVGEMDPDVTVGERSGNVGVGDSDGYGR